MEYGLDMQLRHVFEDEECAAAFDRILPGLRLRLEKKRDMLGMPVRSVAGYLEGRFPQEALKAMEAEMEAELKAIGEKKQRYSPGKA